MPYDGRAVANFVLDLGDERSRPLTNMQLQKIVYFCHAWSLVELRRPLVKHQFEAWEHGPVLQYLYRQFKDFGSAPIRKRAVELDRITGNQVTARAEFLAEDEYLIRQQSEIYMSFSASQLRAISHVEGGPWERVWKTDAGIRVGMKIQDDSIACFYAANRNAFYEEGLESKWRN